MNPIPVWKALPLWAKIVVFPFLIAGVATAIQVVVSAIFMIGALIATGFALIGRAVSTGRKTAQTIERSVS